MKLYIYDHCPYCVKARMIFGFQDVPMELVTLLNDDEATPIGMIGQKMVPILEKDDGTCMPESMDIVRFIDAKYGDAPVLQDAAANPALEAWMQDIRGSLYALCMPRWVAAPLEEFATEGARAYFTRKKEAMIGPFADCLAESIELKAHANACLAQLEDILHGERSVHAVLSEDDIHLFAVLRSLSIVQGLAYPPKVETYRQYMAKASGVPLHEAVVS